MRPESISNQDLNKLVSIVTHKISSLVNTFSNPEPREAKENAIFYARSYFEKISNVIHRSKKYTNHRHYWYNR